MKVMVANSHISYIADGLEEVIEAHQPKGRSIEVDGASAYLERSDTLFGGGSVEYAISEHLGCCSRDPSIDKP